MAATCQNDADRDAVESRKAEWRGGYRLDTPELLWIFEQMVIHSVRLDRCRAREEALLAAERQHARLAWDDERRSAAEELGATLARRPALVASRLRRTKQGVEWLIGRWWALAAVFERKGSWTKAQTRLALDLMGTPKELRDDAAPIDDPAALVIREVAELERRLAGSLNALDDLERRAAEAGNTPTPSAELKDLRRVEAACLRAFRRAEAQLKKHRREQPAPEAPPAPAPEPVEPPQAVARTADEPRGVEPALRTDRVAAADCQMIDGADLGSPHPMLPIAR